jgi:uncharacterized membrane protein YuzA (DUF378 family)
VKSDIIDCISVIIGSTLDIYVVYIAIGASGVYVVYKIVNVSGENCLHAEIVQSFVSIVIGLNRKTLA